MKNVRKVATLVTLVALLCALLSTTALAAEKGSLWLTVEQNESTQVRIVTDTVAVDGVIKLTYDSAALTYESLEVNGDCVAMYAVNAQEPGVVLISWVAPGEYTLQEDAVCLMQVRFSGVEEKSTIVLTGTAHDKKGSTLRFADAPDVAALKSAIADAEALKEEDFTAESYAALVQVLKEVKAVLADGTATQAEVDAAIAKLQAALSALVKNEIPEASDPTESTGTTESTGATEESQDPTGSTATKPTEDTGDNSQTGDASHIGLYLMMSLLSGAAILVLALQMKKKGGRA